jgi:hypothetical protein
LLTPEQWTQLPAQLTVRLVRVPLERPGFRSGSFVLVTTLLDPKAYPVAELIAAYTRRWRLEMSLDDLKTTLGMESLHGKTPAMVHKELLVYLSAHNLIRTIYSPPKPQHPPPQRDRQTKNDAKLSAITPAGARTLTLEWDQFQSA